MEEEPDCWLALGAHMLGSNPHDLQASLTRHTVHRGARRGWLAAVRNAASTTEGMLLAAYPWPCPESRCLSQPRRQLCPKTLTLPSVLVLRVCVAGGLKNEASLPFLPC